VSKPVAIGSDEAGYRLKGMLIDLLAEEGLQVADFGCHSEDPVDYPDIASDVAQAVARGDHDRGILICGTGIGMSIAANKVPGVRAAQAHDAYSAERARKSNDAQILALGARVIGPELAKSIVRTWLHAEFAGGGSTRKVDKIKAAEEAARRAGP
jgi:ribose 5-phosphate isomerase B